MSQATSAAASDTWDQALSPHIGDAWVRRDLTINYRTPAHVMESACAMLSAAGHPTKPPTSVRDGESPSWQRVGDPDDLFRAVVDTVEQLVTSLGEGRLAVIADAHTREGLGPALTGWTSTSADLEAPVVLVTPDEAKGLEFDVVVLVQPQRVTASGINGARELFVAMTRPTQLLVLVSTTEKPEWLTPGSQS